MSPNNTSVCTLNPPGEDDLIPHHDDAVTKESHDDDNNKQEEVVKQSASDDPATEDDATATTTATTPRTSIASTTNIESAGEGQELLVLKDTLDSKKEVMAGYIPKDAMEIWAKKMQEYKESPIFQYTLRVGDEFPDFSLPDSCGQKYVSSVDLLADNPYLVVIFFRGSWCHFCETTLSVWNKYIPMLQDQNASFVAIAPQNVSNCCSLKDKINAQFPILTDEHCEFAQTCMVAYELDEDLRPLAPIIPAFNAGEDDWVIPIPATFVVRASDRKIIHCHYEIDLWDRAEPMDVLNSIPSKAEQAKQENEGSGQKTVEAEEEVEDINTPLQNALKKEMKRLETIDLVGSSSMKDIKREIRALKDAGICMGAIKVGNKMPEFKLREVEMKRNSLTGGKKTKSYESKKLLKIKDGHLVVVFVHGDWSTLCQLTLQAWQDQYKRLQAKGARLVVISPSQKWDPTITTTTTTTTNNGKKGGYDFPILWDENNTIIRQFRLRYQMDCRLPSQTEPWPLPMTATYVIENSTQDIIWSHVDSDHTVRAEPLDVIKNHIPAGYIAAYPSYRKKRGAFSLRLNGWFLRC